MTKNAKRAGSTRVQRIPIIITDEEFQSAIATLVDSMSSDELLAIPGVYEALSEALNNDAIRVVQEARDADAE